MNTIKRNNNNKDKTFKKRTVMGVLKGLTVQSKDGGALVGFDNREYILGECKFNVYKEKGKMVIEDQEGFELPCISEDNFSKPLDIINRLEKGIKYPCKNNGADIYKRTKIFCNFAKFC